MRGELGAVGRLAVVAAMAALGAAGLPKEARAADASGDCCADLEERVADLEAAVARTGSNKVSVKLFGKLNKAVLFWNDGAEHKTYVVDNSYEPTRFGFTGYGKIGGDWTAGYVMEMETRPAGSQYLNQFDNDNQNNPAGGLNIRHSYWYVDNPNLGQVRLGLTATPIYNINKDTDVSALEEDMTADEKMNRSFFLRPAGFDTTSGLSNLRWSDISRCYSSADAFVCSTRRNGVAYWSPVWNGFSVSAAYFQQDIWGAAVRYQEEWGDKFQVGAGAGYEKIGDEPIPSGSVVPAAIDRDINEWAASASIKHLPTGLFAFTAWSWSQNHDSNAIHAGVFTGTSDPLMTGADFRLGIQRSVIKLGDSSAFGGFSNIHDGVGAGTGLGRIPANRLIVAGTFANVGVDTEITGSNVDKWYLGVDQAIDSANMHIYAVFEHLTPEVSLVDSGLDHVAAPLDNFSLFYTGARIYF